ncbi:hypothetical protein N7532_002429 [Penicillium argentinense]|uniref:DUF7732 domain-containing protein n=1 Tax=Penicillium argentinense TaxID=1131581 RepID=A0A9W9KK95_9EURO|nr:uncharacterized protein N7532_002429 [Penicillium argentinense]KAJ5109784.1 hypothetical protein N7532_002429 [Penicillium argentinense]
MKLSWAATVATALLACSSGVTSLSIPRSDLVVREALPADHEYVDLEKRRGGGGGGRGGGSSGGSGGGRSSSSSSGSSRGGSSGSSSSSSNRGGSSSGGSGVSPSYGGGRYYAGGARTPYTAGRSSPLGITPFLLPVAALAFFPGLWLYGAYAYPYTHPYHYVNHTNNHNESLPVVCLCQEYQECGCDDNNNSTYYESLFNDTEPRNTSNARVVNVNGTEKLYINGTLANGTTADDGSESGASLSVVTLMHASGYWVVFAVVGATVWMF